MSTERDQLRADLAAMTAARDAACELVARACDRALHDDYMPLTKYEAREYMDAMEKLRAVGGDPLSATRADG